MNRTIEIPLSTQHCALGAAYARRHLTTPPKAAVLACEGACLRGEVARRAANVLAREVGPDRFVRICHGGLLEVGGGMRDLIAHADRVLMLDGCGIGCGARLLAAAMPEVKTSVFVTDALFELDRNRFTADELSDPEIDAHAHTVAERIASATSSPVQGTTGQPLATPP